MEKIAALRKGDFKVSYVGNLQLALNSRMLKMS